MNRPDWDTSTPGPNKHLNVVPTKEELEVIRAEATNLHNSRGADMMTPEQAFIAQWQQHANVAAGSLNTFRNPVNVVEDRERKIQEQIYNLATALYKLGDIPGALTVGRSSPELVERITWIRDAIEKEDDLNHDCPRPVIGAVTHQGKTVEQYADRRWAAEQVFSAKHGKLVHVWTCSVCGESNATAETPERQQRYAQYHHAINQAFQEGKSLTPFEALLTD